MKRDAKPPLAGQTGSAVCGWIISPQGWPYRECGKIATHCDLERPGLGPGGLAKGGSMKVLIGCERSGIIREAFRARGHDAWSCDLAPAEDGSLAHHRADLLEIGSLPGWDLLIAHPPCRYLSASGMHWTTRGKRPMAATTDAARFAAAVWNLPIPRVCIENPVGYLSRALGPATEIIQPYQYGDDASKRTCLWLRGLLPLPVRFDLYVHPRLVCRQCGRVEPVGPDQHEATRKGCRGCGANAATWLPRWANQTDSGQNRLGPSPTREMDRARTYPGIARAMAEAWG